MQKHLRFRTFGPRHASLLLGLLVVAVSVRIAQAATASNGVDCIVFSALAMG